MIEKTSSFMERLNEAISVKGISAAEISKRTGISDGQLSKYRKGTVEPKADKLKMIADALRVNPVWLMGIDVPMETYSQNTAEFSADMLDDPVFVEYAKRLFYADSKIKDQVYTYIDFLLRD